MPARRDRLLEQALVFTFVIHGIAMLSMAVLLLPGLCALLFGVGTLSSSHFDPSVIVLVIFGLMMGFAGIMLIRAATRPPQHRACPMYGTR